MENKMIRFIDSDYHFLFSVPAADPASYDGRGTSVEKKKTRQRGGSER